MAASKLQLGNTESFHFFAGTMQAGCERVLIEGGSYQSALIAGLRAAELPVVVVNARRVGEFAKSIGQLAKTDDIDARVLALYGKRTQPPVRELPDGQS